MISEKIFRPTSCIHQKNYLGSEKKQQQKTKTGLAVVIIFITRGQSQLVLKQSKMNPSIHLKHCITLTIFTNTSAPQRPLKCNFLKAVTCVFTVFSPLSTTLLIFEQQIKSLCP